MRPRKAKSVVFRIPRNPAKSFKINQKHDSGAGIIDSGAGVQSGTLVQNIFVVRVFLVLVIVRNQSGKSIGSPESVWKEEQVVKQFCLDDMRPPIPEPVQSQPGLLTNICSPEPVQHQTGSRHSAIQMSSYGDTPQQISKWHITK